MKLTSSRHGGPRTLALLGVTGALMFTAGGGSAPGGEAAAGSAAYAAPSKPAPNKKTPPPAKPAPAKPAPSRPSDGPSEAARRELNRLVSELNQKIAIAPNK